MKTAIKSFCVLLILVGLCFLYILNSSGFFMTIKPHFDGRVEEISSPAGVEDLTIDQSNGQVYFSASDRREPLKTGELYTCNANDEGVELVSLRASEKNPDFRPHGISLLQKYGNNYLFAISHEGADSFVYRFQIEGDSILNQRKFSHPEMFISPNDLVAIDTATFYLTNDHGMKNGLESKIKDLLLDKNGYVVLYKNGEAHQVSQKMAYANGINVSPNGKYLYVSSTSEGMLYIYENSPTGEPLKMVDSKFAATGLDNIEMDIDGNLIIGAHPKLLKFLSHKKSKANRSPSQILKIVYLPETDYKFLQEELYLNNGDPLSGSSVGAFYLKKDGKNDLFVGSVFEPKILRLHRNL